MPRRTGPPGFATYGYRPWADLLGLAVDADLDVKEQAEFLLGHAQQIENAIERDPQIGDRLVFELALCQGVSGARPRYAQAWRGWRLLTP